MANTFRVVALVIVVGADVLVVEDVVAVVVGVVVLVRVVIGVVVILGVLVVVEGASVGVAGTRISLSRSGLAPGPSRTFRSTWRAGWK